MQKDKKISEILAMNGGTGPLSYAQNSIYQKSAVDSSKALVNEAIHAFLDPKQLPCSTPFRIADLGCSVGPNTFTAVQNIIEAVEQKYHTHNLSSVVPEFEVAFSDNSTNDFNTLFSSLPPERRYFAAGVPGSFHGRLFPTASIHFVYSSYALHWLSTVPESGAWNEGRIHYVNAPNEIAEAYSAQFTKDMEAFLTARAEEIAPEGLMALVVPVIPNGALPSQSFICLLYELLGSALMDMATMGLVSEAKVHSFNLPIYYTSPQEFKKLVQTHKGFTVEKMNMVNNQMKQKITIFNFKLCILHIRVGTEELIKGHFGDEIIEELFERFAEKVERKSSTVFDNGCLDNFVDLFVLLKRNISA